MTPHRPRRRPFAAPAAAMLSGCFLAPAAFAQADPAAPAAAVTAGDEFLLGLTLTEVLLTAAPFLLASAIAVWFGAERLVVLRAGQVLPGPFLDRFFTLLESGRMTKADALELCEESGSPVAEVFAHAAAKWGRPAVEVEQAVIDGGERQVARLRKHLRVLNAVATVTPLMGLLGTVGGMILAFRNIASAGGMGDAEMLAGGIVTALLTTALGLTVAIPSLILYFFLAGRVESLVMRMDDLAQRVVEAVSQEALEEREAARAAPPRRRESKSAREPRDGGREKRSRVPVAP